MKLIVALNVLLLLDSPPPFLYQQTRIQLCHLQHRVIVSLGSGSDGRITRKDIDGFVPPKAAPVSQLGSRFGLVSLVI